MWGVRNVLKSFDRKPEKRLHGKRRHRWADNIKSDLSVSRVGSCGLH
jgi:hypothetical protein